MKSKPLSSLFSRVFAVVAMGSASLATSMKAGDYVSSGKDPLSSSAPVDTGFYFEGFGGALFLDDLSGVGGARIDAGFDTGWIAGGALGYRLTPAMSLEIEGATGAADLESLAVNGANVAGFSGDLAYSQAAVNLIYEFGPENRITPYLGVGVGAGFADADFNYPGARINDDDSAFLYQAIAGVKIDLGPRTEFFAEYRFGSLDEFELQRGGGSVIFDELQSHQALFGVQIKF